MILKLRTGAQAAVAISVFATVALGGDPAFSQSFTIGNGQTVGEQTMNDAGDTGTVDRGGTISTSGEDAVQMFNSEQRLTNSGAINTSGGNVFNVNSQGDDATIINNGSIFGTGDASIGIVSAGNNADINNNGSIEAIGQATFGIIVDGEGTFVKNQGSITVSGLGCWGIVSDGSNLTILNSGSIEADGQAALGIGWQGNGLQLTNSGAITVSGLAATGIGADGTDIVIVNTGAVNASGGSNTGIITLSGNAAITNAGSVVVSDDNSAGILAQGDDTVVTNSGSVIAEGVNSEGIVATGANAVVTNSGRVFSQLSEAAIIFDTSGATLNLLGGTAIQGAIVFNDSGNTVSFGPGLNAVMTFSGAGGVPETILTGGRPYVVNGDAVAVVDVTGFASTSALIEDLTAGVAGTVETRLSGPQDDALKHHSGPDVWLSTFGAGRSQDGSGASAGFSLGLGGVVAGAEKRSGDGFLGGLFMGAAGGTTDVDDDAQHITHRSVFAGGYLGYDFDARFADLSFMVGSLDEKSSRRVANNLVLGGIETASADFDGVFISPALTLGTHLPVSMGTLIPSLRLRYAGLFMGDYTETGSDGDLSVGRRDVHVFEARGQLALAMAPVTMKDQIWQTTLRAGIDGIAHSNGDVSASLLGQDISFSAGEDKAVVRGFAGADVTAAMGNGMTLNAGIEAGYGSDNAFTARGLARISKAF